MIMNHFFIKSLCVLLLAFACYQTASAEVRYEIVDFEGFEYELIYDDDTWTGTASLISRAWNPETDEFYSIQYGEWNPDSVYYVPSMIGDFPVTSIYGGFGGFSDLKHVVIPSTVTTIGRGAFAGSSIETIYFDGNNYYYDYNVEPLTFGGNSSWYVNHPTSGEFRGCERLKTVEFQRPINKISSCMFLDCPKLEHVYFNYSSDYNQNSMSLDTIGNSAFFNCTSLKSFEIPRSVKVIGDGAFAYCTNLETIDEANGITSIGRYAFAECHQLQGITLNPALQFMSEGAFLNCYSLTSISLPDAITTIQDNTFYDCRNLTNINLNNVTTFGERAFAGCNKLTEIDLTKAQNIGLSAFFGGHVYCVLSSDSYSYPSIGYREEGWGTTETTLGSLKNITLGENVTLLEDRTFVGHVPDTITCWAPAPPEFTITTNYNWTFSTQAYDSTVLRVPRVLVNDYREALIWSRFEHIEGMTVLGNGDANCDGQLSISDVTALIDKLLGNDTAAFNPINADVDGNGELGIKDVTTLIDKLLNNN
ncbi:MAG: leucine-rich repeat protein [Muribaculaceae bacterium]|nr:leucine-rich repeat protein [Muribaculaceae bacterium]